MGTPKPHKPPAADARQRILRAAMVLFAAKGFAATSIRDITQAAGVTNPMVYYYFGSKSDLFASLLLDAVNEMTVQMASLMSAELPLRDRLIELLDYHYRAIQETPDIARLFFQARLSPEHKQFAEQMAPTDAAIHDQFLEMLGDARDRGELASDTNLEVAYLHLGGLLSTPILEFLKGRPIDLSRATAEALVDQFLKGVAPQVSPGGPS
jgi:TetR/AcrR family transcriptional regulator